MTVYCKPYFKDSSGLVSQYFVTFWKGILPVKPTIAVLKSLSLIWSNSGRIGWLNKKPKMVVVVVVVMMVVVDGGPALTFPNV